MSLNSSRQTAWHIGFKLHPQVYFETRKIPDPQLGDNNRD